MPFVQGQLQHKAVSVTFRTACAHCAQPMRIDIDSALRCAVEGEAEPLVFVPAVDFTRLKAPNIIDDF